MIANDLMEQFTNQVIMHEKLSNEYRGWYRLMKWAFNQFFNLWRLFIQLLLYHKWVVNQFFSIGTGEYEISTFPT